MIERAPATGRKDHDSSRLPVFPPFRCAQRPTGVGAWAAAIAMCVVLAVSSSAAAQEERRVVVWHAYQQGGDEERALREVARAFMREHRGVRVAIVAQPFGAYASKLESAIPTGNGPDLFIDAHNRIPIFRAGRLVVPIGVRPGDRFERAHLAPLTQDGRLFGLPIAIKCAVLYVNEALVARDPETLQAIERLELPDGVFPLVFEAENPYYVGALVHAYGASLLNDDGTWGLSGEGAERAIDHLHRLIARGVVPEEASGELIPRLFREGRAATAISGPWLAPDLPDDLRWHVRPLPAVEGEGPMRAYSTVEAVFLAEHARETDHARAFAEFLATGEGARLRATIGRQVVTERAAWSDPAIAGDTFLAQFRAAADRAVPLSTHPNMQSVWQPAQSAIRNVLRGSSSTEAALVEGQHRFEDETRPPPEARDARWAMLAIGVLMLFAVFWTVQRLRDAEMRVAIRRSMPAYAYVAHAAIAIGLLVILPLVVGAGTSFMAGHGMDMHYVGLANYVAILTARGGELLGHGSFWVVLLVTVLWTAVNVVLHLAIGVGLALLLHRPYLRLKAAYRVLLILPWAVPNYVTALAWKNMFHRQFGAVNALLDVFGVEPIGWFSHWLTAFGANVATNTWLGFPFMMVVTLGALTAIPKDVYEAAAVDGASAWQRFRLITMPLLMPFLMPAVAMGSVWTFNMFNVVFLVSGGEPDGSTEILVSEAYRWAFTRGHQYGYAAAYAVLIFLILFVSTRVLSRRPA
jgi:arabinogalactan oligomer/maltooligosaccharide transport system permease protein